MSFSELAVKLGNAEVEYKKTCSALLNQREKIKLLTNICADMRLSYKSFTLLENKLILNKSVD